MTTSKLIQRLRGRLGMARAALGGPAARSAFRLAITVCVAGGVIGAFGAGSATANPVSLTLRYECSFPLINDQPAAVKIDANIPKSTVVGEPTPKFVINAAVPVSAAAASGLRLIGMRTVEGTVNAKVVVAAPQGDIHVTLPVTVPRTNIPESGSFYVKATGTAPALTFSRPGSAKITIGDLALRLIPSDASGNVTFPGKIDAPCKLDPGQNNVVASFDIAGMRTTTGPATPGTPGTTAGSTSGDKAPGSTRHPGDDAKQGTATGDPARLSGSTGMTGGQDTEGLILPAAGTLIAGTLVVAAAFRFRSRGFRGYLRGGRHDQSRRQRSRMPGRVESGGIAQHAAVSGAGSGPPPRSAGH